MDLYLWIVIASGLVSIGGASYFVFKKRPTPPETLQESQEAPSLPKVSTQVDPAPQQASVSKPKFSKALSAWLPLLREKSKDRARWEEALILSDMGPQLASNLIEGLNSSDQEPLEYFKSSLKSLLRPAKVSREPWNEQRPWVLMLVGVNGVGKTTSLVKLGRHFQELGKDVGVIGADTFRKAAIEQLERGCEKNSLEFFSYKKSDDSSEGADPSAVIFDGVKKFAQKDVILVDTSGRLHTKKNLMEELQKMKRVGNKALEGAPHDIWIVLDATLGQNALQQAKVFHEAVQLSGIVLTKLDGLSRGGSVFELFRQLQVPIWFLGLGEQSDDLLAFDPENFVEELFDDQASRSIG